MEVQQYHIYMSNSMNGVYCLNCISKDEKLERIAIRQPLRRIYKHETKENRAMGDKETKTILSRFSEPESDCISPGLSTPKPVSAVVNSEEAQLCLTTGFQVKDDECLSLLY